MQLKQDAYRLNQILNVHAVLVRHVVPASRSPSNGQKKHVLPRLYDNEQLTFQVTLVCRCEGGRG